MEKHTINVPSVEAFARPQSRRDFFKALAAAGVGAAAGAGILELAATFEPVGVGAYLGAAPMIQSPDILAAAGSIAGVEGEHVVAVNNLVTGLPAAVEAFPAALTQDEVLAAVSPFIMGGMMDTGGEEYRDRNSFGRV